MAAAPGDVPPTEEPPPADAAPPPVAPGAPAAPEAPPSAAKQSLMNILNDFGRGTKDLLRFVFIENRAERRKELVESLRFYVTYK